MRTLGLVALLGAMAVPVRGELPPLIPRQVLFGNPVKASPRISPDGKRLSYLAPDKNGVLNVFVQTIGKDDAKQVTFDESRGVQIHQWTYAPHVLIYLQDNKGDENFHIFAVNVETGKGMDLTPFEKVRASPLGTHRDYPSELLVSMNRRKPNLFDVYRVNLETGKLELEVENPGDVVGWVTDTNFRVRIAQSPTPDGGTELRYRPDDKTPFKKMLRWGPDDADGGVVGFTKDNKNVYMLTSEDRDTQALVKRELETGKETEIASNRRPTPAA